MAVVAIITIVTHSRPHRVRVSPIVIPTTTPACVVFPYDSATKTFKTTSYSSDQTEGRAHLEEIKEFLKEINDPSFGMVRGVWKDL